MTKPCFQILFSPWGKETINQIRNNKVCLSVCACTVCICARECACVVVVLNAREKTQGAEYSGQGSLLEKVAF